MQNTHFYKILHESKNFKLIQRRAKNTKKVWFEIHYRPNWNEYNSSIRTELNAHFGKEVPSGLYNMKWRIKHKEVAQKKYTWALLKWG